MEAGPGLRFNAVLEPFVSLGLGVPTRSGEGPFSLRAREAASSERREWLPPNGGSEMFLRIGTSHIKSRKLFKN